MLETTPPNAPAYPAGQQPLQENVSFENKQPQKIDFALLKAKTLYWFHKLVAVALIVHGVIGVWETILFLVVEYPELNHLLEAGQLTTTELTRAVITIIFSSLQAAFSFFLAHRSRHLSEEADLLISILMGLVFLALTPVVESALQTVEIPFLL